MRLVSYDRGGKRRLAAWIGGVVVDLPDAVGHPAFPSTLESLVARNGGTTMDAARAALRDPASLAEFSVSRARMLPLLAVADGTPDGVLPPEATLTVPDDAVLMSRPQLACIVGRAGRNLDEAAAGRALFGYTLLNEWRARAPGGSVIAMGTAIGPCVATADEFDPSSRRIVVSCDDGALAEARVGASIGRRFGRTIAAASRSGAIEAGEIFGVSPFPDAIEVPARGRRASRARTVSVAMPGIGELRTRVRRG